MALRIACELKDGDCSGERCLKRNDTFEKMSFEADDVCEMSAIADFDSAGKGTTRPGQLLIFTTK